MEKSEVNMAYNPRWMTKQDIEDVLMRNVGSDTIFNVVVEDWQACITLEDNGMEMSRLIEYPDEEAIVDFVEEFNKNI